MARFQIPQALVPASLPIIWTQRTSTNQNVASIEYNGSNLYVAVCSGGVLFTSPDGTTWTSRTSGFGSVVIRKVAFGNGLWVAVGSNGVLTTSTDGITWTARTANMSTNNIFDVKYANGIWVAVGGGGGTSNTGGITYSTDGITWTRKSQSLTVGANYNTVVWNGTNWVIGASHSTNNYLYASTPSGTWTAGATGSSSAILSLFWDGTRHIEVNSNGNIYYSTSTTLGTTTQLGGGFGITPNYFYNGQIFTNGTQVITYSTTPTSNNNIVKNNFYLSPSSSMDAAGILTHRGSAIFVGSVGTIIGQSDGQIYTSF